MSICPGPSRAASRAGCSPASCLPTRRTRICRRPSKGGYSVPFPGTPAAERALAVTMALAARLQRLARASGGEVTVCRSVADIRASLAAGSLAAVLHIEGAEAIDPELEALEVLHAAGLRSLGPVWSRPNIFGSRRAVPLPQLARYRPRPDRCRQGAGARLQRAADHARPQPSQRGRLLGRRSAQRRAAGRDPLQRPRALPLLAQPHRQAAGRDPRVAAEWSGSTSR